MAETVIATIAPNCRHNNRRLARISDARTCDRDWFFITGLIAAIAVHPISAHRWWERRELS
jgi:hypothetical protein